LRSADDQISSIELQKKPPAPVIRKLIQKRLRPATSRNDIDEKTFRWLMNEDAMATEKTAKASATSMRTRSVGEACCSEKL